MSEVKDITDRIVTECFDLKKLAEQASTPLAVVESTEMSIPMAGQIARICVDRCAIEELAFIMEMVQSDLVKNRDPYMILSGIMEHIKTRFGELREGA